ncbi:hypothetical protein K504DRAFT_497369 [Pleomassaria siparia CBS 279.74]|uniref:Uncharacterized protein n=1 Tax=Pleomassaria siparia CBS 279.74 TaxID=1314801 RepID=A0A6G1KSG8_9PLEO|nr:hypothetical protein K504DRAFT_497369 [Pleomassaria siparia CBS 279.74]
MPFLRASDSMGDSDEPEHGGRSMRATSGFPFDNLSDSYALALVFKSMEYIAGNILCRVIRVSNVHLGFPETNSMPRLLSTLLDSPDLAAKSRGLRFSTSRRNVSSRTDSIFTTSAWRQSKETLSDASIGFGKYPSIETSPTSLQETAWL